MLGMDNIYWRYKMRIHSLIIHAIGVFFLTLTVSVTPAVAEMSASEADQLAKQVANPVAALTSIPLQFNYDANIGPRDDGKRYTLNIQPVIPFELNDKWNLISRTIFPLIRQTDISPGVDNQTGVGDTVQSLFFSPRPGPSGMIWGVGPVFLLPTATDDLLGTEKWGVGPTGAILQQKGPWTYGILVNHIESFAGEGDRADISSTFFNPFLSRRFPGAWTLGGQLEHTLDHENDHDTGQCSVFLSKVTQIGGQAVNFNISPKYWYQDTATSPEGFAFRVTLSFLFPK